MRPLATIRAITFLSLSLLLTSLSPAAGSTCERSWLGPQGVPLPFCTEQEVLDFLREAEVVGEKPLGVGINRPVRLDLERDGVRARAIFRTVAKLPPYRITTKSTNVIRDSYVFEVAAFELSRLLGLTQVPPAALREIKGKKGSIQLWVEEAEMEASRMSEGLLPIDPASWYRQRQLMVFFDQLIDNFDRHSGNILVDRNQKIWFVDHTRSFRRYPYLASPGTVKICDRETVARLKDLSPSVIEERLRPYLEPVEIRALLKRRLLLIDYVDRMVAERGEGAVLLDLSPRETRSPEQIATFH